MAFKSLLSTASVCVLTLGMASTSNASILTFDGISDFFIPEDYGDNITSTLDGVTGYEYGMGNGFTPNITVEYAPDTGGFSLWPTNYAELVNALGHGSFDVPGEIILTPDPGYQVTLNSFDIAGWVNVDYQTQFAIYDDNGSLASPNLFSADLLVPGANSINPLAGSITATGSLHIFVSNIGSTGIDNINFDQTVIPVPAAVWLFGSGLLGLIGVARRKKS